jgi:putative ABC transport system permease protein
VLRAGAVLATVQVALAVVLLVVASLATRSVIALVNLELGFEDDGVLTLRIELPAGSGEAPDAAASGAIAFFEQTRAGIAAVAAVESVAWTSRLPLEGGETNRSIAIEGRPEGSEADVAWVGTTVVTPGYFVTLGIPVTRGRPFERGDDARGRPVALVSEAAALRYWEGEDPVGARVKLGGLEADAAWLEVVGVVGDTRNPDADQPPAPQLYLPLAQNPTSAMALVARTRADEPVIDRIRQAIWDVTPDQPIDDVRTMGEVLYDDFAGDISAIGLMVFFALVALALSTTGVYAVIAANVSRRQREIGIRMALGARQGRVMVMVLRQGVAPVVIGLLIGLAGASVVAQLIAGALFGVGPRDPATFASVPALLLAVGLVASLMPALRATRVDPREAVQAE